MNTTVLPPNQILKPSPCRPFGEVIVDAAWKPLLNEMCVLKEALDHATRWHGKGGNAPWVDAALKRHGLQLGQFEKATDLNGPHFPNEFIELLLGTSMVRLAPSKSVEVGLVSMPPWAVIGWVRKDKYRDTACLPADALASLANVANDSEECPSTDGFEGLPFFQAGEGKNRTQLQRLAGVPRVCRLVMHPRPAFHEYRARPLALLAWAVALEHPHYPTEVLPFGPLSKKLLLALGVPWTDSPSWRALTALRRSCGKGIENAPSWSALLRSRGDHANLRLGIVCGGDVMRRHIDPEPAAVV